MGRRALHQLSYPSAMSDCCDPRPYKGVFGEKEAKRTARLFEKRGLGSTAGPMVEALARAGIDGATVIEVGSGSATAIVGMLERGAASAVGYDISPEYEEVATSLLAERGLADRVDLRVGDFVADATEAGTADVVFLNKVVCCYPDREAMMDAATGATRRMLAISHPRRRWLVRILFRITNTFLRIRGSGFRVHLHHPDAVTGQIEAAGLTRTAVGKTPLWHWSVWERTAA